MRALRQEVIKAVGNRLHPSRKPYIRKALWVVAVVGAAALLGAADRAGLFGFAARPDVQVYHEKAFTVVRVVDGDTLDVSRPDAVRRTTTTRVRLLGIDAPETVRPNTPVQHFGPEATTFTRNTVEGRRIRLRLAPDGRTRCRYDRLLAYVLLDDGRMFNRLLVSEGYAYADPRYAHPHRNEFLSIMGDARRAKRGLWAEVTDKDLPYYLTAPHRE